MTVNKPVYKCPVCGYETHFPKALEAHMKVRKHKAPAPAALVVEVKEEPAIIAEESPAEKPVKKTRKPRAKKNAESEE